MVNQPDANNIEVVMTVFKLVTLNEISNKPLKRWTTLTTCPIVSIFKLAFKIFKQPYTTYY